MKIAIAISGLLIASFGASVSDAQNLLFSKVSAIAWTVANAAALYALLPNVDAVETNQEFREYDNRTVLPHLEAKLNAILNDPKATDRQNGSMYFERKSLTYKKDMVSRITLAQWAVHRRSAPVGWPLASMTPCRRSQARSCSASLQNHACVLPRRKL